MAKARVDNSIVGVNSVDTGSLSTRQPVVVIMGHIDHGKSTLLDYIRKTNVVEREAGGITQHISAYEVERSDQDGKTRKITFLDTPGHEAFTGMRSRGAQAADIAILIVSAEDGVKPQTLEALKSITDAKLPYIVAINKIDRPGADVERTKNSLLEKEIYLEGLGGNIPYALISAKTGEGVPELLDLVLLASDLEELTGNTNLSAKGIVVESHVEPKKGISATLIIKDGKLMTGMYVVVDECFAPVRIMENFAGKVIKSAQFSSPVKVIGFSCVPNAGAPFTSVANKKEAEAEIAKYLEANEPSKSGDIKSESEEEDERLYIPIIIKTDVSGTTEAIRHEIEKVDTERTDIKILSSGVGTISEGDIHTAGGSENAIVIGFNVNVDVRAKEVAERLGIEIKTFTIIYELVEWLEEAIKLRTPKIEVEEVTGKAKILKTFSRTKDKSILGGSVSEGVLNIGGKIKILRRGEEIGEGKILNLQMQKVKTKTVSVGEEFGAEVQSSCEPMRGDEIIGFVVVTK